MSTGPTDKNRNVYIKREGRNVETSGTSRTDCTRNEVRDGQVSDRQTVPDVAQRDRTTSKTEKRVRGEDRLTGRVAELSSTVHKEETIEMKT